MLLEVNPEQWPDEVLEGWKVLRSNDTDTINKIAENAYERAWALELTAQRARVDGFDPWETRRSREDDAWLVRIQT